jgi:NhaA family Na+:H+ antiporter
MTAERDATPLTDREQKVSLRAIETLSGRAQTPLQRLEEGLHAWVAYFIVPLFALANAGLPLRGDFLAALAHPVGLGVIAGLVLGKQLGIALAVWLVVRTGLARLPRGVGVRQVYGAAWLAGIGFTMSLFIAGLAFGDSPLLATAKAGILVASAISGIGGILILRGAGKAAKGGGGKSREHAASA